MFVVTVIAALLCCNLTAFAAVKTMPDGTLFDAVFYAASNPDVAAVLGTDEAALYQHYTLFGKAEGRAPAAAQTAAAPAAAPAGTAAGPVQMPDGNLFDAAFYAATYPDVAAVFGTDPAALYQHYVMAGAAEGRLPYAGAGSAPVAAPAPAPAPAPGGTIDVIPEIGHSILIPAGFVSEPLSAEDIKNHYVRYYTSGNRAIAVQYIPGLGVNDTNTLIGLLQNAGVDDIMPIEANGETVILYEMTARQIGGMDGIYNGGVVEIAFYPTTDDGMVDIASDVVVSYLK